jgi:hypothetical protein
LKILNFTHHVSDDFKAMDIPHMTFIQELLPAVTQMATPITRNHNAK